MPRPFENVAVYLIGFPGVGKYTIAKALAEKAPFQLVDNHLINNPVFSVVGVDGITPLSDGVWKNVEKIRAVVFDTIEHLAPRHLNYILTNHLADEAEDRELYDDILASFEKRETLFVPVVLAIDPAEHEKRIISHERRARFKEINPEAPQRYAKAGLLSIDHPNKLAVDVSEKAPSDTAGCIIDHIEKLLS